MLEGRDLKSGGVTLTANKEERSVTKYRGTVNFKS